MQFTQTVKQGSPEALIKAIQKPLKIQETGIYGPTTTEIVKNFQRVQQLPQSGEVDKATWDAIFKEAEISKQAPLPTKKTEGLRDKVIAVAKGELAVREQPLGSNCGPRVDEYNKVSGAGRGAHWCLSFVYWCLVQACKSTDNAVPIPKTAYCPTLHSWALQHLKIVSNPQPGDIFLVRQVIQGQAWAIHTGFVLGPVTGDPSRVKTIEGNTNNDGSSNGIGVFERTRSKASCWFVRID